MARSYRKKLAGYPYLIFAQSVPERALFEEETDFLDYLEALEQKTREQHLQVFSFCLQRHSLRLALLPQKRDLAANIQSLHGRHTRMMNRKHGQKGKLFADRFRSILFAPSQLAEAVREVHLYPVRAGRFRTASGPRFSSHRAYITADHPWSNWLETVPVLSQFNNSTPVAQKAFSRFVESAVLDVDLQHLQEATPGVHLPKDLLSFLGLDNKSSPPSGPPLLALEPLLEQTCLLAQVSVEQVTSASRKGRLVMARRLFVTAAMLTGGHRGAELGRMLNRNKSQISRLFAQGEEDLQRDEVFQELYGSLVPEHLHAAAPLT